MFTFHGYSVNFRFCIDSLFFIFVIYKEHRRRNTDTLSTSRNRTNHTRVSDVLTCNCQAVKSCRRGNYSCKSLQAQRSASFTNLVAASTRIKFQKRITLPVETSKRQFCIYAKIELLINFLFLIKLFIFPFGLLYEWVPITISDQLHFSVSLEF